MSQFLAAPQRVGVVTDAHGRPVALLWHHRRDAVAVCNHWRVVGDWWRRHVAREYYRLLTRSGSVCTVFHDLDDGRWYLQQTLD